MTATFPAPRTAPDASWALVERAQAGDREALAEIYRAYQPTVARFIYRHVGHRQLTEDFTAEVFVRLLRSIGSLRWQGRDLAAWLTTTARNLVADHYKSGRYRFELLSATAGEVDEHQVLPPCESSEATAVSHLTHVDLLAAVKTLTEEQQQVLVYRFLHGLSVAETAMLMGKNEGAIKALQYRATQRLSHDPQVRALAVAA